MYTDQNFSCSYFFFFVLSMFFFNGLLAITEMCVFACVWKRDRAYEGAER